MVARLAMCNKLWKKKSNAARNRKMSEEGEDDKKFLNGTATVYAVKYFVLALNQWLKGIAFCTCCFSHFWFLFIVSFRVCIHQILNFQLYCITIKYFVCPFFDRNLLLNRGSTSDFTNAEMIHRGLTLEKNFQSCSKWLKNMIWSFLFRRMLKEWKKKLHQLKKWKSLSQKGKENIAVVENELKLIWKMAYQHMRWVLVINRLSQCLQIAYIISFSVRWRLCYNFPIYFWV